MLSWQSRVRRGLSAAHLFVLVISAPQFYAVAGAHVRLQKPTIPYTIWVTGEWDSHAPEINKINRNINSHVPMAIEKKGQLGQRIAELRFRRWLPIGSKVRYFSDADMADSVRTISRMLEEKNVTSDALKAFSNLRPAAYRADLWRYMVLWAYGGVYLDANIRLMASLDEWIGFQKDRLVLVEDGFADKCAYWNAMMAAAPQDKYLAVLIRYVVDNIQRHFYGDDALAITGPIAVCEAFRAMDPEEKQAFEEKHLRCELIKETLEARVTQKRGSKHEMARKDESLHHFQDPLTHYGPMWDDRRVYCDELDRPESESGMCGPRAEPTVEE